MLCCPEIAAREWETRKERIAKDAGALSKKLADQTTFYQRTVRAMIDGQITAEDFKAMKAEIETEKEAIQKQITDLDSESSTMEDLINQARVQMFDLERACMNGSTSQKQELVKGLFPDGLKYSSERTDFVPEGTPLYGPILNGMLRAADEFPSESTVGVPDGI